MKACPNGHPNEDNAKYCPKCEIPTVKAAKPKPKYLYLYIVCVFLILTFLTIYFLPKKHETVAESPQTSGSTVILKLSVSSSIGLDLASALVKGYLASEYEAQNIQIVKAKDSTDFATVTGNKSKKETIAVQISIEDSHKKAFKPDLGLGLSSLSKKKNGIEIKDSSDARFPIGLEGLAVVVNKKNSLKEISICDLASVYAQNISEWKDICAFEGKIQPLALPQSAISMDYFNELVLENAKCPQKLSSSVLRLKSENDVLALLKSKENGIGFVSSAKLDSSVNALAIYDGNTRHLKPTAFNISSGDYLLLREVYLFYHKPTKNPEVNRFIEFCSHASGQKLVADCHYAPLLITKDCDYAVPQDAVDDYKKLAAQNCRLSVTIYFKTGKEEVDDDSKLAFERVVEFISRPENKGKNVNVCGFTDNVGSVASNNRLAKNRAEKLKAKLADKCSNSISTNGFGPNAPIADNSTDEGREKNRRAEIWISK